MKILKAIFISPFLLYVLVIVLKNVFKYIKMGYMRDDKGKLILSEDWFMQIAIPVLQRKEPLRRHICWIFWITIALFITSLNT